MFVVIAGVASGISRVCEVYAMCMRVVVPSINRMHEVYGYHPPIWQSSAQSAHLDFVAAAQCGDVEDDLMLNHINESRRGRRWPQHGC